jgi:site-specific DNA recombinase
MARKIIRPLDRPATAIARPANARPQRVAVYVRVSSEEQLEGYSLDAQLRAARAYIAERGWEIAGEPFVEDGKSARYEDLSRRPKFKALLEAAEQRRYDVVLVHKLDRFARNLLVLLETLGRLGRADVSLESCSEQLDYSTPHGRLFMVLMGGIAEWYSNNLSKETRKGKKERKDQGLYNGLLPFGTTAGPDGIPVEDRRAFCVLNWTERDGRRYVDGGRETCNFDGLRLAVRLCTEQGLSDGLIAQALTSAGYRTTGNRGANPFSKDTVSEILTNRFYWGELPVYEDVRAGGRSRPVQVGWTPGKHDALDGFDEALWERIQAVRDQNRRGAAKTRGEARTFSLTGLVTCHECGGRIGIMGDRTGKPRLRCRNRIQKLTACKNSLTWLEGYEAQLGDYLAAFQIPADYQERLLAAARAIDPDAEGQERERRLAESQLERIKKLFEWGDKPEAEYLAERDALQRKLTDLTPKRTDAGDLEAYAAVLRDVSTAWEVADQAERNLLARVLFEDVRVLGHEIVAVKPKEAFAPFFRLNYELWKEQNPPAEPAEGSSRVDHWRKRRDSNPRLPTSVRPGYLPWTDGVCPGGRSARARRSKMDRARRDTRVRELALAGMPWPAIADEVGLSPTRVRQLCTDLPRRKSGRRTH